MYWCHFFLFVFLSFARWITRYQRRFGSFFLVSSIFFLGFLLTRSPDTSLRACLVPTMGQTVLTCTPNAYCAHLAPTVLTCLPDADRAQLDANSYGRWFVGCWHSSIDANAGLFTGYLLAGCSARQSSACLTQMLVCLPLPIVASLFWSAVQPRSVPLHFLSFGCLDFGACGVISYGRKGCIKWLLDGWQK